MALNYDLTKVAADYKDDAVWPTTNALIWGTMSVGLNSITEKNWKEFYTRCYMIELIHGAWRYNDKGDPIRIQPEEVKEHIGLHTNATNYSNAQFKKQIDERFRWGAHAMLKGH
jgi:hypothetical protein|tara:strand:- start:75 stop:416 length:342 start_codon:yes stop_codon:yes gene_type:complete